MITDEELFRLANEYSSADTEISALICLLKDLRNFQRRLELIEADFSLIVMAQYFEVEVSARLKRALKNR
ncbi:hypothetical protein CAL7716_085780 [Calothrix sp. PCC 7716]|nr:hypothetical protein CAL7716_085780 [Calothrix sp. PCC 7716]